MTPIDLRSARDEDGDIGPEIWNEAYTVAEKAGIHILSDRELTTVAVDERGRVVGALFTAFSPGESEYTFDVAVDPHHQRQGIGTALTRAGIREFAEYADLDDARMNVDVVNPTMERILEGCGFHVIERIGSHAIMQPQPSPAMSLPGNSTCALGLRHTPAYSH